MLVVRLLIPSHSRLKCRKHRHKSQTSPRRASQKKNGIEFEHSLWVEAGITSCAELQVKLPTVGVPYIWHTSSICTVRMPIADAPRRWTEDGCFFTFLGGKKNTSSRTSCGLLRLHGAFAAHDAGAFAAVVPFAFGGVMLAFGSHAWCCGVRAMGHGGCSFFDFLGRANREVQQRGCGGFQVLTSR